MVVGAVVLSLLTLAADKAAAREGVDLNPAWTFTRGPEGSRALLATVAGSMLTIAGLCFSITIVALQQASTQFGPRLLYNFMRDRGNQVVLGTFIAAFTYCLLVLRTVNGTDDGRFVPHLSVTAGLLLALAGVGVLIYFVHHAAASLQAEHVIAAVGRDLDRAVERLYPDRLGDGPPEKVTVTGGLPPGVAADAAPVTAAASEYIRAVDGARLLRATVEHDLLLELIHRPGQFVFHGSPLLRAWPPDRVTDEVASALRGAFYLGSRRTLIQDIEFAIDQLVEVALRALSPGINDPFTAMACVDRLGAGLCELARRRFPSAFRYDDGGRLRVVAAGVTPAGVADAAFHQIRQAARTSTAVTLRMLDVLAAIGPLTRDTAFREPLLAHAALIYTGSRDGLPAEADRTAARERYQTVLAAFAADAA